jgi:hypothetical protein
MKKNKVNLVKFHRNAILKNAAKTFKPSIRNEFMRITQIILNENPTLWLKIFEFETMNLNRKELGEFHSQVHELRKNLKIKGHYPILTTEQEERIYKEFYFSCFIRDEANSKSACLTTLRDVSYRYDFQHFPVEKIQNLHYLRRNIHAEKKIRKHLNNLLKILPKMIVSEINKIDAKKHNVAV